ncbi:metallophosphoesterase family protein [Streptacidiphilus monticola]
MLVPRQRRAAVLDLLLGEPSATCGEELTAAVAELYAAHPAHPLSTPPRTAASRLTGQQISARLAELAEAAEHADAATAAGHRARWDRIVEAARLVDGLGSEGAPLIGPPRVPGPTTGLRAAKRRRPPRKPIERICMEGITLHGPADGEGPPRRYGPVSRVAVLSDIHGNVPALRAVLAEPEVRAAELVVLCGDLTWGPEPQQTYELLAGLGDRAVGVRGNADRYAAEIAAGVREPAAERESWIPARHSQEAAAFLARLPFSLVVDVDGLGPVRFCHGSPRSDHELVTPGTPASRFAELAAAVAESTIVTGHTHLQFDRVVAGKRSVNPGSVGLPFHEGRSARRTGPCWVLTSSCGRPATTRRKRWHGHRPPATRAASVSSAPCSGRPRRLRSSPTRRPEFSPIDAE